MDGGPCVYLLYTPKLLVSVEKKLDGSELDGSRDCSVVSSSLGSSD